MQWFLMDMDAREKKRRGGGGGRGGEGGGVVNVKFIPKSAK
jgi:hypothetical protein